MFLRSDDLFIIFEKIFVMPANKNALLRYRAIDRCLQNRYRKWTLDDLIEACSDALYEFTGKSDNVSRRTVQLDIQKMRSEELGYCAPIVVRENKYYEYENPRYSITDTPLTAQDMEMMAGAVATLKQLSGFAAFSGMEDHLGAARAMREPVIFYEKNDGLKGLGHIPVLYAAIVAKRPLRIEYQSFKARDSRQFTFSPYCLKEFCNRWFVFGRRQGSGRLLNLALDRMLSVEDAPAGSEFISRPRFDPKTYFEDMVGVTKDPGDRPVKIWFKAKPEQVPYIETKLFHRSQMVVERNVDGSAVFQIEVVLNFEIERDLLGYADGIRVISPKILVERMRNRLSSAAAQYRSGG